MRLFVALGAAVFAAAVGIHPPSLSAPAGHQTNIASRRPLVAILERRLHPLARIDPLTLRPHGQAVPLSGHTSSWVFSPDRSKLALASWGARLGLRFVDLKHMGVLGDVRLARRGYAALVAWPSAERLLALVQPLSRRNEPGTPELVSIDPQARRLLARTVLPGTVLQAARSPQGLVLLLAPPNSIAPVRLLVADGLGPPRSVTVDQISGGLIPPPPGSGSPSGRIDLPGLAIDPGSERAYVIGAGEPVAEVDLRTLAVSYHALHEPVSLLGRLHNWLEPRAAAKGDAGPARQALWLGNGLIGLSGADTSVSTSVDPEGNTLISYTISPAGLRLIDTTIWSVRTIDRRATQFSLAGGALLATAVLIAPGAREVTGIGLVGYDLAGRRHFHRFASEWYMPMQASWPYAYVFRSERGQDHVLVLRLPSGQLARDLKLKMPTLVSDDAPFVSFVTP